MVTTVIPIWQPTNVFPSTLSISSTNSLSQLDPLAFVSDVFDSIFPIDSNSINDLEKRIRSVVLKKMLVDNSRIALTLSQPKDVEEIIQFILVRIRELPSLPI